MGRGGMGCGWGGETNILDYVIVVWKFLKGNVSLEFLGFTLRCQLIAVLTDWLD